MAKERAPRPTNPALARLERVGKQSTAYHQSAKLEKQTAAKFKGYRTAGSGNKREKGDVRVNGIARLEHKATCRKSFSVTRDMIDKISNAGVGCDEVPAVIVEFLDDQGKPTHAIACIPLDALQELINNASS
jgi:hypothetical protein